MGLVNKKGDMTPFDMREKPMKPSLLLPVIWGGSFLMTRQFGLKIEKVNMEGLKPPYLVLSTHQGFSDYYIGPLSVFPHRAMYVSDMEGFAAFGKTLYRAIGCIGKRRYVPDTNVILNIKYALKEKQVVMIFPESRHSNIGITAEIPDNLGRLVKMLKVPLVILSANGSYLANPFWNEEKTRKVPMRAKIECVYREEEIRTLSAEVIQKKIEEKLQYDEYRYQQENGIKITAPDRAEGLEKALYQCISCKTKYKMISSGAKLSCKACGKEWTLTEEGRLNDIHPPKWYLFQKEEVEREMEAYCAEKRENNGIGKFGVKNVDEYGAGTEFIKQFSVRVEALPNEKGFINLGEGRLTLSKDEFWLEYCDLTGRDTILQFPHKFRESVQTEYNYRKKGKCIVLSTKDCCYYVYSDDKRFEPTELQFAGEYFFKESRNM